MSYVNLPQWRRQPLPGRVRINRSHPLVTSGDLRFAWTSVTGPVDLVTGTRGTIQTTAPSYTGTAYGVGQIIPSGTHYIEFAHHPRWSVLGEITMFYAGRLDTSGDRYVLAKTYLNGATNTPWALGMAGETSGRWPSLARANAAGFRVWRTNVDFSSTVIRSYSVTQGSNIGTAPTFYVNGVNDGLGATNAFGGGATGAATEHSTPRPVRIFNRDDVDAQWTSPATCLYLFARQLPAAAHLALHLDPWQLFEPEPLAIWVGAAAGGAAASLPPYSPIRAMQHLLVR